jgi:hypothetical protein
MDGWTVRTLCTTELSVAMAVGVAVAVLVVGCAASAPKDPPAPSPAQVRSNADRTFDKLKQEERDRQVNSPGVPK